MPSLKPTPTKRLYQLTFEGSWPTSVAFLGSGRRLAAGNQLGQIFVWDLPETPPAADAGEKEKDKKPKDKEHQAPNVFPVRPLPERIDLIGAGEVGMARWFWIGVPCVGRGLVGPALHSPAWTRAPVSVSARAPRSTWWRVASATPTGSWPPGGRRSDRRSRSPSSPRPYLGRLALSRPRP